MKDRILSPTYLYAIISSAPILLLSGLMLYAATYFNQYAKYLLLAAIFPIILFSYKVLLIKSRKFIIENEQLIFKRGIFSITEDFLELYRVKDYKVVRLFQFRIIGVMTLELETSDKTHPTFKISGIRKSNIIAEIRTLTEVNRRARGVREFD